MHHVLAVDLGASSGRVMVASFDGQTVNLEEIHRFKNQPLQIFDRLHWNVYSIFNEVKNGISIATRSFENLHAIGIDGWGVDYGLLDEYGELLALPRHYRDTRNVQAMDSLLQRWSTEDLFYSTGIQIMPINTVFQLYAEQMENPRRLTRARHLLLIPDLLNYFLTSEMSAEFTNATTTQLINANSGRWDKELIRKIGLPSTIFPSIYPPATLLGTIIDHDLMDNAIARSMKVVRTTSHDTASAVIAVPGESEDVVYISSGTWSLLGTVVRKPIINEQTKKYNFTNEGGYGNYRLLKNIMGLWLLQETQRVLSRQGISADTKQIISAAEHAPPCLSFVDPDDPRLLQTGDIPQIIRQICRESGQYVPESIGELTRCILESLALKYRWVLDQLEELTGKHYEAIHIVGGGSQNQLLSQFTASATGRRVISGPGEASALGNVLVQLVALGEISGIGQIRQLLHDSFSYETYAPQDQDMWESSFHQFKKFVTTQLT